MVEVDGCIRRQPLGLADERRQSLSQRPPAAFPFRRRRSLGRSLALLDRAHFHLCPLRQRLRIDQDNLAVLHLLRGDYDGAQAPLSEAVSKSLKTESMYGRSLNNLGVLAELRGDRRKAQALYADALGAFAGIPDASAQERHMVETNLARLGSSR